jgi:Flagellar hook protein FlgE
MLNFTNSLSALTAHDLVVDATTHNIANINTNNFKSYRVDLADRPFDSGVKVGLVSRDYSPGPAIINSISTFDDHYAANATVPNMHDQASAHGVVERVQGAKNEYGEHLATWNKAASRDYAEPLDRTFAEGSNVDLPREFANLAIAEHAYSANAAVIRAQDDMSRVLIDIAV